VEPEAKTSAKQNSLNAIIQTMVLHTSNYMQQSDE
jgi:hypothetical protein